MRSNETQKKIVQALADGAASFKDLRVKIGNPRDFSVALDRLGESDVVTGDNSRRLILTQQGQRQLRSLTA